MLRGRSFSASYPLTGKAAGGVGVRRGRQCGAMSVTSSPAVFTEFKGSWRTRLYPNLRSSTAKPFVRPCAPALRPCIVPSADANWLCGPVAVSCSELTPYGLCVLWSDPLPPCTHTLLFFALFGAAAALNASMHIMRGSRGSSIGMTVEDLVGGITDPIFGGTPEGKILGCSGGSQRLLSKT